MHVAAEGIRGQASGAVACRRQASLLCRTKSLHNTLVHSTGHMEHQDM